MKKENLIQMKGKICLLFLGMVFLSATHSFTQEKIELLSGIRFNIQSAVLNETRVLSVSLPDSYVAGKQKYPVLYLLDGNTHFQHATSAVNFLSTQGLAPEMIVVSIHNVDRSRDFSPVHDESVPTSGGAKQFLDFVDSELIKQINKKYRTSGFNILMGHSFGGTFATYSLLYKPEVFDAYIAVSPYMQFADNYVVNESKKLLKPKYDRQKYFYMTVGNEPDYFQPLSEFAAQVKEKSGDAIKFDYVKMEAENHGSIPYITLFNGLRFVFSEWTLPQEKFEKGLTEIDNHYKTISKKYGFEIATPENTINLLGYRYLRNNEIEKAIEVFAENVKRYPGSANVYDSLGEAYENNKQLDLARENYKKAYEKGKLQSDQNTAIYLKNFERVKQK